ncbi:MAG: hypothetical protein ACK42L_01595, partial [Thermoanaerobaculum sp.]
AGDCGGTVNFRVGEPFSLKLRGKNSGRWGLANAIGGEPRATVNVNVTVEVVEARVPVVVGGVSNGFWPLPEDPGGFVPQR